MITVTQKIPKSSQSIKISGKINQTILLIQREAKALKKNYLKAKIHNRKLRIKNYFLSNGRKKTTLACLITTDRYIQYKSLMKREEVQAIIIHSRAKPTKKICPKNLYKSSEEI